LTEETVRNICRDLLWLTLRFLGADKKLIELTDLGLKRLFMKLMLKV
jgi:hypothetical protein